MANENRNGVPSTQLADAVWRKSSISGYQGNCVEVAELTTGEVAVRNSRHPEGPALIFTSAEWQAFVGGVHLGEFGDA